jgi:hypothetical protein
MAETIVPITAIAAIAPTAILNVGDCIQARRARP